METTILIRNLAGQTFSYNCSRPRLPSPAPDADPQTHEPAGWTRLSCHRCPGCPLQADTPACPAAEAFSDIFDSPFARQHSWERVWFEIKHAETVWRTVISVQEALGWLILYRLWESPCPLVCRSRNLEQFFSPKLSYEKLILQYISVNMIYKFLAQKTDASAVFEQINPKKTLLVVEHMLYRIRSRGDLTTDAIPNALCHIHAIFRLMDRPTHVLLPELLDSVS